MHIQVIEKLYENSKMMPDENAVYHNRWYTYKEFADLVDKAASFLLKNGYSKDSPIPLYFDPSIEALILIYAVLKIGAFYIPFHRSQPMELIRELLNDCGNSKVLCHNEDLSLFSNAIAFDISDLATIIPTNVNENGNYAYQLFTSGTTGRPKGVLVTAENLNYFTNAMNESFSCDTEDSLLWTTSWTFDVSVVQIFGFVVNAGKLVIPTENSKRVLAEIPHYVQRYSITHLNLVPTVMSGLLSIWSELEINILNKSLKYLMVAGESFNIDLGLHIKKVLPEVMILNLYGPTEATVYATMYEVTGGEQGQLPIGKALPHCEIAILSNELQELSEGEVGEICIGGQGVAAGYVNNNDLTESRFIQFKNKRFYRTGDFGCFNQKGEIEYYGRRDRQVKINGTRIELGEIESKLNSFFSTPGQVRAIHENTGIHVFYVGETDLRAHLEDCIKNWLPSYAQPISYISVAEFPTTSSGKLNEKALLELVKGFKKCQPSATTLNSHYIQSVVCKAFSIDDENLNTSFSDLGNDSLTTVLAIVRIENELKLSVPDTIVLGKATPIDLINYLTDQVKNSPPKDSEALKDLSIDLRSTVLTLQSMWKNLWLSQNDEGAAYTAHALQRLYYFDGFESTLCLQMIFSQKYTVEQIEQAILKVISGHQLLCAYLHGAEEENLKFTTKDSSRIFQIPKLKFNTKIDSTLYESIIEQLASIDKEVISGQILHTPVLVTSNTGTALIWTLSHLICDQASVYILKKQIVEMLDSKGVQQPLNKSLYSSFIDFQNKHSRPEYFAGTELTKNLLALDINHTFEIEKNEQIIHIILEPPAGREMNEKIGDICFQIGCVLAENLNIDRFAISTIANIRSFSGFDASQIIGDCHSTVVFPFDRKKDKITFITDYQMVFNTYKNGGSPYFAAFSTFPVMSELQRTLEKAYDSIPIVGINYLGAVAESDSEEIQKSLKKAKKSLMNFPGKRIYVTVFEDSVGAVHAYFLTYPLKKQV